MRAPSPTQIGVFIALLLFLTACSADPVTPPATERATTAGGILTSFDRLTIARGDAATFRASLIGPDARLSSAGLRFASRNPSVASLSAGNGLAQVQGVAAGHTWVVVETVAASDSVEIVVE
jgi:hypothetical protein